MYFFRTLIFILITLSSFFGMTAFAVMASHQSYFDKDCLAQQSYPAKVHALPITCDKSVCYIYPKTLEVLVRM